MKIAYILSSFPNVSETFITEQIKSLKTMGHDVKVLTFTKNDTQESKKIIKYLNIENDIHIMPNILKNIIAPQPAKEKTLYTIEKFGKYAKKFIKNNFQFDAVVAHFGLNGLRALMLREIGYIEGPIHTIFHGYDVSQVPKNHGKNVYKYLFEKTEQIISISEYWKKELINLGCPENKIVINRMGINPEKFNYQPKASIEEPIQITSISRLTEKKGIEYAIEAIKILKDRNPNLNIKYTIAGDGPLKSELQKHINDFNLEKTVKLVGVILGEQVTELLQSSHIFLAPSITAKNGDMEGIPVALMEAMAMGVPVISTYHSGIPELIEHHVTGFLTPEKNTNEIVYSIEHIISQSLNTLEFCKEARNHIEKNFNNEILHKQFEAILKEKATSL